MPEDIAIETIHSLQVDPADTTPMFRQFVEIKRQYPDIFKLDLNPAGTVSFDEIVAIMDQLRKAKPEEKKFAFKDTKSDQLIETDLMFPDITFGNVVEQ